MLSIGKPLSVKGLGDHSPVVSCIAQASSRTYERQLIALIFPFRSLQRGQAHIMVASTFHNHVIGLMSYSSRINNEMIGG